MSLDIRNAPELCVKQGTCYAFYAYDVGATVDLDIAARRLVADGLKGGRLRQNRRAPRYFDYQPLPLLITQEVTLATVGGFQLAPVVDFLIYDFGAISVSYRIPFSGPFETMRVISCKLTEETTLLRDSRERVEALVHALGAAVHRPGVASPVEDYAVFQIDGFESAVGADRLHEVYAQDLARILRGESEMLSAQEVADALACRLSFGPDDMTLIDWNAAIVFDRDADDVRAVLEFANVELLEMRYLDHQLDTALDRSYEAIARDSWWRSLVPGQRGASLRRVSQMQVDGAILFERVTNAPKLIGDQYLARVYRLASQRFHLPEWNATTLRKLDAIESIYKQMHDRAASRRLEALEWIIILLIAFEIVLGLTAPR